MWDKDLCKAHLALCGPRSLPLHHFPIVSKANLPSFSVCSEIKNDAQLQTEADPGPATTEQGQNYCRKNVKLAGTAPRPPTTTKKKKSGGEGGDNEKHMVWEENELTGVSNSALLFHADTQQLPPAVSSYAVTSR